MIFDSLKNSALYYPVSPRLEKAFGFIASTDWETMEPGIHELDGKDIYANVMEPELKKPADAKLEIHDAYIDIQVLIRGEQETFGWSERATCASRWANSMPGRISVSSTMSRRPSIRCARGSSRSSSPRTAMRR